MLHKETCYGSDTSPHESTGNWYAAATTYIAKLQAQKEQHLYSATADYTQITEKIKSQNANSKENNFM